MTPAHSSHRRIARGAIVTMLLVSATACSSDDSSTDASDMAPVTTPIVADAPAQSVAPADSTLPSTAVTDTAATGIAPPDGTRPEVRTIEHQFGNTEIPADPQRIVALSEEFLLADLLALGIVPIASTSNDASVFSGVDPAATDGIENIASADFNIEQLAALRPDMIVAYPAYIDLIGYDLLNDIAPTVAIGDADSDWAGRFKSTAAAFGLGQQATARISEIEVELDAARQVLGGIRVSVLSISPGPFIRAYTDDRTVLTEVMDDLDMEFVPDSGDTDDNGRIEISLERLGELSGDLLVLLQATVIEGEDAAVEQVTSSPLWATLPAVRNDAVVTLDQLAYPGADGVARFAGDLAAAVESR